MLSTVFNFLLPFLTLLPLLYAQEHSEDLINIKKSR